MPSATPACSRFRRSSSTSKSGRKIRSGSRWSSSPPAITAPQTARNVSLGTPSQSAHEVHARVSSTRVSPTSKTTARMVTAAPPPGASILPWRLMSGAILPGRPAQWLAGQPLRLEPRSLVDLLDAAQIEAIDEHRLDVLVSDPLLAEHRDGVDDGHEHLGCPVEQAIRLRSRVHEDRPRHPERRHLERYVVGHLVDPVR